MLAVDSGQQYNPIVLMPRRTMPIAAGQTTVQIDLNLLSRHAESRRATEHNRRDSRTVRLSRPSDSKNWTSQDFHVYSSDSSFNLFFYITPGSRTGSQADVEVCSK